MVHRDSSHCIDIHLFDNNALVIDAFVYRHHDKTEPTEGLILIIRSFKGLLSVATLPSFYLCTEHELYFSFELSILISLLYFNYICSFIDTFIWKKLLNFFYLNNLECFHISVKNHYY